MRLTLEAAIHHAMPTFNFHGAFNGLRQGRLPPAAPRHRLTKGGSVKSSPSYESLGGFAWNANGGERRC